MNKHWRKVKLSQIAEEVRDLYEPKAEESKPYIGLEHIEQQSLQINGIGDSAHTQSSKKKFKKGDILFGSLRPYFRKVYRPSFDGVCSTDITVIQAKEGYDQVFLFYLIANKSFIDYATSHSNGTRMPRANWKVLEKSEWALPDIPTQRRIASILSSYDDLIENNSRRIKILEQMAQMIYREWFVNFRFPGYEKVKMVNSRLGRIPEGWEIKRFTDCIDVLSGGTPKTIASDYWGGEIPFFTPKDSTQYLYVIDTERHITEKGLNSCSSKLYQKNTVFITARGTVGNVVLAGKDMAMSQSCYALVGKDKLSQLFVYYALVNQISYLKKNTGGATFDTIIVDTFKRMDIVAPDKEIIAVFNRHIEALMNEILNILNTNRGLAVTRDLLLPKLVGGEVEV